MGTADYTRALAPILTATALLTLFASCGSDCPSTDPNCQAAVAVTAFSLSPLAALEGDTVYAHVETRGATGTMVIGPFSDTILVVTEPAFDAPFVPEVGGTYTAVPQPNGASRTVNLSFLPLTVNLTVGDMFPTVGDTVMLSASAPFGTDTLSLIVGTEEARFLENSASWRYPVEAAGALEVTARAVNNAVVRSRTKTMIGRDPK